MANKVRIFLSLLNDPQSNLALEEMLLRARESHPQHKWLLLWRNNPSVVMGRFQNPWIECNTTLMKRDGIHLARRLSGGGTVYHDLGNLCFSFFDCPKVLDKGENLQLIVRSLKRLGISLQINERYDLLLGGKKVSGSAFKYKRKCALHHGTLLVSSDLDKLTKYLSVQNKQIISKSIPSVASAVANVSKGREDINIESVIAAIYRQFCLEQGSAPIEVISDNTLRGSAAYQNLYKKFESSEWVYGETPRFTQRFTEKIGDCLQTTWELDGSKGRICGARVVSPTGQRTALLPFETYLNGKSYSHTGIREAQKEMEVALPYARNHVQKFCKTLLDAIG